MLPFTCPNSNTFCEVQGQQSPSRAQSYSDPQHAWGHAVGPSSSDLQKESVHSLLAPTRCTPLAGGMDAGPDTCTLLAKTEPLPASSKVCAAARVLVTGQGRHLLPDPGANQGAGDGVHTPTHVPPVLEPRWLGPTPSLREIGHIGTEAARLHLSGSLGHPKPALNHSANVSHALCISGTMESSGALPMSKTGSVPALLKAAVPRGGVS